MGSGGSVHDPNWAAGVLQQRAMNPALRPVENLPDDTKLWSLLQGLSGGTWGGCVYDHESLADLISKR